MKSLRLLLCALPLALTGCSTMSSVNWSAAYPWNWFGSSTEVTEQGVGNLTASTPLSEQALGDALGSSYRLRSGMKTANGNIVRYFEALKDDKVALTINGESGTISRIDVRDSNIKAASGTHGLYFCAYCARLYNIEQQLLSMFGDTDGKRDAMLRFTKPVTGGYYFAPSLDRLLAL